MSEALQSLVLSFDEPPRAHDAHTTSAAGDAPRTIAQTLRAAGIDAPCSLYNEALELARDGHLGQAVSRLQMLLGLDPDDADALLLLAKTHAAQGRAQDALTRLDSAAAAGAVPPAGFRDYLEAAIRADRAREEEHKARLASREQGEVKALRTEARQLRSETVRLESELGEALDQARMWKLGAIGASAAGSLIILAMVIAGFRSPSAQARQAAEAAAAPQVAVAADADVLPADVPGELTTEEAPSAAAVVPTAPTAIAAVPAAAPAAEVAPTASAPTASATAARTHVVGSGDTLYKLASRYYGNGSEWTKIRDANKSTLKGKIDLSLGQELVIP